MTRITARMIRIAPLGDMSPRGTSQENLLNYLGTFLARYGLPVRCSQHAIIKTVSSLRSG